MKKRLVLRLNHTHHKDLSTKMVADHRIELWTQGFSGSQCLKACLMTYLSLFYYSPSENRHYKKEQKLTNYTCSHFGQLETFMQIYGTHSL